MRPAKGRAQDGDGGGAYHRKDIAAGHGYRRLRGQSGAVFPAVPQISVQTVALGQKKHREQRKTTKIERNFSLTRLTL